MKLNKIALFSGVCSVFLGVSAHAASQPALLICQGRECADVEQTLTKKMLHSHLNELFSKNIGRTLSFCDAVPGAQTCYTPSLKVTAESNVVNANISVPTVRVLDVKKDVDTLTVSTLLDADVEVNGTYPKCDSAPAKITIGDNGQVSVTVPDFGCAITTNSMAYLNMGFAVDYIDFDNALIGAYYTMGTGRSLQGNRSGYALLRFEKKPDIIVRLNQLPLNADVLDETEIQEVKTEQSAQLEQVIVPVDMQSTKTVETVIDPKTGAKITTETQIVPASSYVEPDHTTTVERVVTITTSGTTATALAPIAETVCPKCTSKACPPCVAEKIKSDTAMRSAVEAAAKAELEAKAAAEKALELAEAAAKATSDYAYQMAEEAEKAQQEAKKAAEMAVQARAKVDGKVAALECHDVVGKSSQKCSTCEDETCPSCSACGLKKNTEVTEELDVILDQPIDEKALIAAEEDKVFVQVADEIIPAEPVEVVMSVEPKTVAEVCTVCTQGEEKVPQSSSQEIIPEKKVVQVKVNKPEPKQPPIIPATKNTTVYTTVETVSEVTKNGNIVHYDKALQKQTNETKSTVTPHAPIVVSQQQWEDARGQVYQINGTTVVDGDAELYYQWPETKTEKGVLERISDKMSDLFYLSF